MNIPNYPKFYLIHVFDYTNPVGPHVIIGRQYPLFSYIYLYNATKFGGLSDETKHERLPFTADVAY